MTRFLVCMRLALKLMAVLAAIALATSGMSAAQTPTQTPPPEKIQQLIDILSDPAIKAWLAQQTQAPPPSIAQAAPAQDAPAMLSSGLAMIKSHSKALLEAFPHLPSQFERARNILLLEFEEHGILGVLALIAGFIAAGFGLEKLARLRLAGYRHMMKALPTTNPANRLKSLALRLLYAFIMIAAFTIGSAGVFLVFAWPPLLREIVLAYLTVAVVTRIVLMICRSLLMPPFLGLPDIAKYRVVPMSDERATHWYIYAGLNTAWFTFVGATLGLLGTLGFDPESRLAIGSIAGFIQLIMVLAAVWMRPPNQSGTQHHVGPKATSWLLTTFFITLWLLRVSGSITAFWVLFAAVALPATISAARIAVQHVLRPPEDDTEPFPQITIAVIDRGLRVVLIIAAAYFLTRVWGLDLMGMTEGDTVAQRLLRGALNAAIIILAADFGWSVAKALIARWLGRDMPEGHGLAQTTQQARLRTLLPIFQNILFAVIVVMTVLMALSSMGVEIGPLIAGAGVVGIAVGFGSQTLVKDIISGIFYLFDDAFRVGEWIESGSFKGTVESFGLRSVKLRHSRGYIATVPFGELGAVQNMSRDWVIDKFSITVGFDTDVEKVRKLIKKLGLELAADPEFAPIVIEPLKMQGIQNFGDYGIELRMKMMTKPGEQFLLRRRALVRLKQLFKENGIEVPFPTVHVQGAGSATEASAAQKLVMDQAAKVAGAGTGE
jgi:small-conductance mechanosensitive channel